MPTGAHRRRTLYFRQCDLIQGTPVLDIKPYHPSDAPLPPLAIPQWVADTESARPLTVTLSADAVAGLSAVIGKLEFYHNVRDAVDALTDCISFDPRPVYVKRRNAPEERYAFRFDRVNVVYSVREQDATVLDVQFVDVDDADMTEEERTALWLTRRAGAS